MSFDPGRDAAASARRGVAVSQLGVGTAPFGSCGARRHRRVRARRVRTLLYAPGCATSTRRRSTAWVSPSIGSACACATSTAATRRHSRRKVGRLHEARRRRHAAGASRAARAVRGRASTTATTARCARSSTACSASARNAIDIALIHDVNRRWQGDLRRAALSRSDGRRAPRAVASCAPRARSRRSASASTTGRSCERFAADGDFDCFMLAGRYTLLDHTALDTLHARLRAARHRGADGGAVQLGHPRDRCAAGRDVLLHGGRRRRSCERTRRIEAVCARHGVALAAAALQFPLAHPAVASVVTGMRNAAEADANLAHCRAPIPAAFWAELKHERLIDESAPLPAGDASRR